MDSQSGLAWSRRRLALARELKGSGTVTAESETGAASAGGPSAQTGARTLDLTPSPVGDTPVGTVPSGTGAPSVERAPGSLHRPAQLPQPQIQPQIQPRTQSQAQPPASTAATVVGSVSARTMTRGFKAQMVDLYALAPQASWSSTAGSLPFNGSDSDNRGFARALGSVVLSDGQTHDKVLQAHPSWKNYGSITGSFTLTIPATATQFAASVAFLPGADRSDGVLAKVTMQSAGDLVAVASRRVLPSEGLVELAGAVPAQMRGKPVTLALIAEAGASSSQDWFVWVAPVIR
jgi:hypothetical protein